MRDYEQKVAQLRRSLKELGRVAVAFSGGVDSSVLLHAAHAALGERAVGLIADSASLPRQELEDARELAASMGARLVELTTDEFENPDYLANRGDRCYHCKSALFEAMVRWARREGVHALALGEITDDALDERPGRRAAAEFGVHTPLSEAGLGKQDVRRYAREAGLPVAEKPASACLASRIPVGVGVTREALAQVEAAEDALHALGLRQLRVRHRGESARVEVAEEELPLAREAWDRVCARLSACGFRAAELFPYIDPARRR